MIYMYLAILAVQFSFREQINVSINLSKNVLYAKSQKLSQNISNPLYPAGTVPDLQITRTIDPINCDLRITKYVVDVRLR